MGKAALLQEGSDITIITYGMGVHWAMDELSSSSVSADLLDLRTLAPLDTEAIYTSVKKTGKVLILQEDSMFGGIASDISALISENCFEYLDAPIMRVASLETPVPFATNLEANYLPKERFKKALQELLNY
jgi:2-oxoisovalerate dehydrogenase E1 component